MGRVEVMKYMIEKGANINHVNNTGSTPLHAGSLNGYGTCMELLIEKGSHSSSGVCWRVLGADINFKNKYGYTPLNYADSNSRGHSPIYNNVETLEHVEAFFACTNRFLVNLTAINWVLLNGLAK